MNQVSPSSLQHNTETYKKKNVLHIFTNSLAAGVFFYSLSHTLAACTLTIAFKSATYVDVQTFLSHSSWNIKHSNKLWMTPG